MKKLFLLIVCITCFLFGGCKKKNVINGVPHRPEVFPEILTPPDDASEVRYLSPETGKIVKGAYSLSYWLKDEYPAEKTIDRIQKHLRSQDCVRVKGSVLSDLSSMHVIEGEGFNKRVVDVSEEFRKSLKQTEKSIETQWRKPELLADYAEYVYSTWHEEWITPDDEKISIVLEYYIPENEEKVDQLYVNLSVFTPSSWMYPHVQRYKEKHPEKFINSINDPNNIEKAPIE